MSFPIPATMHPLSLELTAIEALDLAQMHASNAWDALQHAQHELHDFLEARASYLFRKARAVAPELAASENYSALQQLP